MTADPGEGGYSLPFDFDIAIEDSDWDDVVEDPEPVCFRALSAAMSVLDKPKTGELSIAFFDDPAIQSLNRTHRNLNKPTNVLSFPSVGPAPLLGDIVIARETVLREADMRQIDVLDHLTHLLIHSFLHLQGYDHQDDASAEQMEALEIAALARLGIDNPYEIKERD